MKILFDHQIFSAQYFGGISRYFSEIYRQFLRVDSLSTEITVKKTENIHFHQIVKGEKDFMSQPVHSKSLPRRILNKFLDQNRTAEDEKRNSLFSIRKSDFDIFHPTYYDPYFLAALAGKPFVVTVFDMIYELYPEYYVESEMLHIRNSKKKLIESADHVIAISESTSKDLQSFYNVDKKKISVIPLGATFYQQAFAKKRISTLPEKYLLFVGNRGKYKNFQFFLLSIIELLQKQKNLFLVITGPSPTVAEKELFRALRVSDKIIHHYVADEKLPDLYSNALAFIFPSLYEGFGLPILEAFSNGCPCILANTSSLPEVAGDAALYFEAKNAKQLRERIELLLEDNALRENLIRKGFEQVKKFTWENTAKQTLEAYNKIVGK